MNLSGISSKSALGRLLRLPLGLIPAEATLPILQGRLRGKKWIVAASDHGCWLGSYEYKKRLVFESQVQPGTVVFDVGAQAGFYTLLASVLVGAQGRVFAFEPVPSNLAYLRRHMELNGVSNVSVIDAAVTDRPGWTQFELGPSASMGHLSPHGAIRVRTVCLDDLVRSKEIPVPGHVKIDVEGSELLVLRGAQSLLAAFHPTLYLATDLGELHHDCCQLLRGLDYTLAPIDTDHLESSYEILAYRS